MSPPPYTEDSLVQQTTADYLEQQLGWKSVYAFNTETFGPGGGRAGRSVPSPADRMDEGDAYRGCR